MSKVTNQESGVVGGDLDVSGDTTVAEPNEVIDAALNRRHEADRRGKLAAQRIRAAAGRKAKVS